uniref:RNA exonuclease 5 n=1 Tax=Scophthalmus maximus TaxID=52904 RepID=A0A8D3E2Y6_SCOMX
MEPSAAAATSSRKKRRNSSPAAHGEAKRFKAEREDEGATATTAAAACALPSRLPRVSVPLDRLQQPITLNELTELLHFAALGRTGGVSQPSWCRLHHQKNVKGVNVVIVEDLSQSHFYRHYLTLRHLRTNYTSEIFSSEVPKSDSLSQLHKENSELPKALKYHPVITKFGTQRRGLTAYLLTQEEMVGSHYPVKGESLCDKIHINTESVDSVTDSSPLYGLDCEMCLTEKGNELTRVSLVDSDGNCVLDDLVKPETRILNYLTKFSGITAGMLGPITTTLADVQAKLKALLPRDAVLVGHSLNSDLKALKLIHRLVIDTSLLYRKEFGQRFKLKILAEMILRRQIQTEEVMGHNPIEDAVAALELAQYFIRTGPQTLRPSFLCRFADILQTLGRCVQLSFPHCLSFSFFHTENIRSTESCWKHCNILNFTVCVFILQVCANLRDMCAVFAGPFPAAFTAKEVKRLFRCCGPVRKIKMLNTAVHAEVEFKLLEGARLALKTLNGYSLQGQSIKVALPFACAFCFL